MSKLRAQRKRLHCRLNHILFICFIFILFFISLRSWRYCVIKVLAEEPRSKKKGVGTRRLYFSRLRRSWRLRRQLSLDWYSGSAAKSPSPSTQHRQLCRLIFLYYLFLFFLSTFTGTNVHACFTFLFFPIAAPMMLKRTLVFTLARRAAVSPHGGDK